MWHSWYWMLNNGQQDDSDTVTVLHLTVEMCFIWPWLNVLHLSLVHSQCTTFDLDSMWMCYIKLTLCDICPWFTVNVLHSLTFLCCLTSWIHYYLYSFNFIHQLQFCSSQESDDFISPQLSPFVAWFLGIKNYSQIMWWLLELHKWIQIAL